MSVPLVAHGSDVRLKCRKPSKVVSERRIGSRNQSVWIGIAFPQKLLQICSTPSSLLLLFICDLESCQSKTNLIRAAFSCAILINQMIFTCDFSLTFIVNRTATFQTKGPEQSFCLNYKQRISRNHDILSKWPSTSLR